MKFLKEEMSMNLQKQKTQFPQRLTSGERTRTIINKKM